MSIIDDLLAAYPVVTSYPVQWGDQDAFGHVNNTIYLRWTESARIDYMSRIALWKGDGPLITGPILASMTCNYKIPLTYPDTVHTGSRVTRFGNSSFQMSHRIVSVNHSAVAAEVDCTLVYYDYTVARPARVPDEIRDAVARLERR
jgi:acyl-CoA thioester hydrolase